VLCHSENELLEGQWSAIGHRGRTLQERLMSLAPILKVTLKQGLSPEEMREVFNEISLINGLSGIEASPSHDNILYCGGDAEGNVDDQIRNVTNVVSVDYFPLP
jgi:hypothetical protein